MAERLARAARAARELSEVLWETLEEELSPRSEQSPRAQQVTELSERVAAVSSTVAALALHTTRSLLAREPSLEAKPSAESEPSAEGESPLPSEPTVAAARSAPSSGAVIVDEREEDLVPLPAAGQYPSGPLQGTRTAQKESPTTYEQPTRARPLPWDEPMREEMRVTRRTVEEQAVARSPDAPA
jgi:hypothetical protein